MNINKNNYESWFLDYHEKALTAEQVAELFLFLEKYPEFKNEFETFSHVTLPEATDIFSFKDSLKKNVITLGNYAEYLIAELEGDLNLQERIALKTFLEAHPEIQKDRLLFNKTILRKDASVIYPDKQVLKKRLLVARNKFYIPLSIAAAAIILMMIGVYFIQLPERPKFSVNRIPEQKHVARPDSTGNYSLTKMNEDAVQNSFAVTDKETTIVDSEKGSFDTKKSKLARAKNKIQKEIPELALAHIPRLETQLVLNTSSETPEKIIVANLSSYSVNNTNADPNFLADNRDEITEKRFPLKSRIINLIATTVNRVSNNKVKFNTDFDVNGNLAAYQVSAGKFKVEKNF